VYDGGDISDFLICSSSSSARKFFHIQQQPQQQQQQQPQQPQQQQQQQQQQRQKNLKLVEFKHNQLSLKFAFRFHSSAAHILEDQEQEAEEQYRQEPQKVYFLHCDYYYLQYY
jgi:hypothetical protein